MPALKKLAFPMLMLATGATAFAAEGGHEKASSLQGVLGLPVTNSILFSCIITVAIIVLVRWLVATPKIIPTRGQAIVESAVDGLRGLYEPIVGKKAMPMAFPVLITLFIFIVFH